MYEILANILLPLLLLIPGAYGEISAAPMQQDPSLGAPKKPYHSLLGLSEKQVIKRLGIPDSKSGSRDSGNFQLHYGNGVVFFSNGRVTAWSDPEALSEREGLVRVKIEEKNTASFYRDGWINPWTPEQEIDLIDVIAEMIKDRD